MQPRPPHTCAHEAGHLFGTKMCGKATPMCLIKQQLLTEAWDNQQVHIAYMLENQVHPMALTNMEASILTMCMVHKPCHLSISRCKHMLRYMP